MLIALCNKNVAMSAGVFVHSHCSSFHCPILITSAMHDGLYSSVSEIHIIIEPGSHAPDLYANLANHLLTFVPLKQRCRNRSRMFINQVFELQFTTFCVISNKDCEWSRRQREELVTI